MVGRLVGEQGGRRAGIRKWELQLLLRLDQSISNCLRTHWTAVLEICGRRRLEAVSDFLSTKAGFPLLPHGYSPLHPPFILSIKKARGDEISLRALQLII